MKKFPESDYYSIVEQYQNVVRKFINMTVNDQWVADDLTQETFIKAYKSIDSLEDISKIKSWLIRISYNLCLDHFKTASKNKFDSFDSIEEVFSSSILPMGKQLERNEMSQCVQKKMLLLPQSYRTILCLFDIAGLSHSEIAEVLDVNVGNVKVRLHRARREMKEILKEHCNFGNDYRAVLTCTPK
ncbi:MAG: RNA polymerase sigma factor [Proteobacteria bacterium]|nr:RNA polymerase sigma factor [Pseudomonadota bacterium]